MYELVATNPDTLEFVARQGTLALKIMMLILGLIGVFLLLLAVLFLWLKGLGSASFQIALGFGLFIGGASLLLRNHLATMQPEPAKITINSRTVEFLSPDGSLQLRLPASLIEDFAITYDSQSKQHHYTVLCLRFRPGSLLPLHRFLRQDLAAEQLARWREKLRALRISKTAEPGEDYPALLQVAALDQTQFRASLRYPLSPYRSLWLPVILLLGFALAFLRILYEVLGATGVVVVGLLAIVLLFFIVRMALRNSGAEAELIVDKKEFSYQTVRAGKAEERLRSPLATFRAIYLPDRSNGYVALFKDLQTLEQHLKLVQGESTLQEGFETISNILVDLLSPGEGSTQRLSLPGFNNIQQFSLAMWLNRQQESFSNHPN